MIDYNIALEDVVRKDQFIRRRTLRKLSYLTNPRIQSESDLMLPVGSVLHYESTSLNEMGPPNTLYIAVKSPKQVFIRHVTEYTANEGNPRKKQVQTGQLIQQYRSKHRRYRPLTRWETADKDPLNLIIINYSMLHLTRHYPRSEYIRYYKWFNHAATVVDTIASLAPLGERTQFMHIRLPKAIPSLALTKRYATIINPDLISRVSDDSAFTVMDLLTWVMDPAESRVFGRILPEDYDKVTLIIDYLGKWVAINLGVLNGFIKREGDAKGSDPRTIRAHLLNLFVTLRDSGTTTVVLETDEELEADSLEADIDGVDVDEEEDTLEVAESAKQLATDVPDLFDEDIDLGDVEIDSSIDDDDTPPTRTDVDTPPQSTLEVVEEETPPTLSSGTTLMSKADQLLAANEITPAQHQRLESLSTIYQDLPNPYDPSVTIAESTTPTAEDLAIPVEDTVPAMEEFKDPSMAKSTVEVMQSKYVTDVLPKDILAAVSAVQAGPVAITNYTVSKTVDGMDEVETHTVTLVPAKGKSSTVSFTIPTVRKDGTFKVKGNRYYLRTQRGDVPIRKVLPHRVALTTYVNKLFVERSELARFNYDKWIGNTLVAMGLDNDQTAVTDLIIRESFSDDYRTPSVYAAVSHRVAEFTSGAYKFQFDYSRRPDDAKSVERRGSVYVGQVDGDYLTMDKNNGINRHRSDGSVEPLGTLEDVVGIPVDKRPINITEMKLGGSNIPLGFILAYLYGFDELLKRIGAKYRKVLAGARLDRASNEFAIRFSDETYLIDDGDVEINMLLNGLNKYRNALAYYSVYEFDKRDVYLNVLQMYGIGIRVLNQIDTLNIYFVDPISKDILEMMREPTTFDALLLRSNELLRDSYVPKKIVGNDKIGSYDYARGYERIAGTIYGELVRGVSRYNNRAPTASSSIQMNPNSVYMAIVTDSAAEIVDDINPIQNLKEKEVIIAGGTGGQSGRTLTAKGREYTETDQGFISEGGVDSGNTGAINYMTPNASFTSVRGTVGPASELPSTSRLSSAALIKPFADHEDMKRTIFSGIQDSHSIAIESAKCLPVMTGYDYAIAHRTDDRFAVAAPDKGKVIELTPTVIVVQYKDEEVAYPLGRTFANSKGAMYPHEVVTEFAVGDTVAKGDIVCYERHFFQRNYFNPKQVAYKISVPAMVALTEGWFTFEDSSGVSHDLGKRLSAGVTERKYIRVNYDQHISDLVKVGTKVDLDTPLCYIHEVDNANLTQSEKDFLSLASRSAPKAGMVGVVEKINVFYNGDTEEYSDSLQAVILADTKSRAKAAKELRQTPLDGATEVGVRVGGNEIEPMTMIIEVFITTTATTGNGYKLVFSNQLKSTVGYTFDGITTKDGIEVDALFGSRSVQARIVMSAKLMGTTNALLANRSKYFGQRYRELKASKR